MSKKIVGITIISLLWSSPSTTAQKPFVLYQIIIIFINIIMIIISIVIIVIIIMII